LVHEAEADQWYADGVPFGAIGINQQAGVRFETPERLTLQGRMATVPRGGRDPHAHVQDMDRDTVAGGVLYPSQGLTTYRIPDSALLSAIFRAYNDWLADFCQPCPQRLKSIGNIKPFFPWHPRQRLPVPGCPPRFRTPPQPRAGRLAGRPAGSTLAAGRRRHRSGLGLGDRQEEVLASETRTVVLYESGNVL
jgi:hypothetical protein